MNADETVDAVNQFVATLKKLDFRQIAFVALLFVVCYVAMKILIKVLNKTMERLKVDRSLQTFIRSIVRVLLWFVTIIIVAGYIGVNVSSLVAILGVVGLAISLAIQGTLSNLAGGIMLLVSKPFTGGDYIETDTFSGVVSEVGMVYTKVKTFDNKIISIPNGKLSAERITNYTSEPLRRVDLKFNISYDADPGTVVKCMLDAAGAHAKALFTPEPFARITGYLESSVEYTLRVWCATGDYWDLYYDLLEQIGAAFGRAGVELTYNHLNVHLMDRGGKEQGSGDCV